MNELTTLGEQLRMFSQQHVPQSWLSQAIPIAILTLVGGIVLSVLGAKMARAGMTGAFVLGGAVLGHFFARDTGFAPVLCMIVGAAAIGLIGHLSFRIWVGVVSGIVMASLALGAFGQQRLLPHVAGFAEQYDALSVGDFSIPTPEEQKVYAEQSPQDWARGFWAYVSQKDARTPRYAKAIGMVALISGLLVGLLAARATLILSTAVLGTTLVIGSTVTLVNELRPGSYQALLERPGLCGLAIGGFLVTSLILQSMLTHKGKVPETKAPPKS